MSEGLPTSTADDTRKGVADFNFISIIGKGNYAKVMLAERKTSRELFAVKVFKKNRLIENRVVEGRKVEKNILIRATLKRHPFVVQFHSALQTETRLYLVLEYVSGGDLEFHIQQQSFDQKRAQFYGAEVCLGLKFFHENGILYRSVKLDNIVLAPDGHIKIIDFGISKEGMGLGATTSSFVGTSDFMAPEMLLEKPYGFPLDWWDYGVLMYQMICHQSPFTGTDEDEIYDAILDEQQQPAQPTDMPRATASFLQKLLTRDSELRLGSGPNDAEDVMKHEYFAGVDWDGLYHKTVPAPFLPVIKKESDTSNFDPELTSVAPVLTPVESVLTQAMQDEFRAFSSDTSEIEEPEPGNENKNTTD